jgi:hypothetical protein
MNKETQILEQNGFIQGFPFVDHFRKDLSKTSCIKIHTCYHLKRNDIIEDGKLGEFNRYIKVTKINLPISESKIFHKLENALLYTNLL